MNESHNKEEKFGAERSKSEKNEGNDVVDGVNIKSLRRVGERVPLPSWIIILIEFCERFAFRGGVITFMNYAKYPYHHKKPAGALGKGQTTAYALKQVFALVCYIWPLCLGIICDQYWGKYKSILFSCCLFIVGWSLLTLTAIPPALEAGAGLPGYCIGLVIVACGSGGIKSLVQPMAADQFQMDKMKVKEVKGEMVVVDPEINSRQVYHYFMCVMQAGSLIGGVISPYIESRVGFWLCFLFPAVLTMLSTTLFFTCRDKYVKVPPTGNSALVKLFRCYMYGRKRRNASNPKPSSALECAKTNAPSGVPPETEEDKVKKTWDDEFVDNARETLNACKILAPTIVWALGNNQVTSSLVSQAASMNRPSPTMSFPTLMYVVYPTLERLNIPFRPMKRMVVGFMLGGLGMASSAIIQDQIHRHKANHLPEISVWWQLITYFLMGLSEIFVMVTPLEYCYTRTPQSMKGLVAAVYLLPYAGATLIDLALSSVSQRVWTYGGFSIANGVMSILFWYYFGHIDREDEKRAKAQALRAQMVDDEKAKV
ncbi:MFS general substrate transporter [Basidiobolus meristosporus CBS 931.73]|uniref:MFS general substrate transporter n=1 Tax=Basidiobolus meristosporus CBS 931.73 TaxID=1314790 RepID=A0A1Y1Z405_9FUNG|nr:MFS general substrate transporter [Basidiobolus meristosporus CBS 931.73]|eukprot:ORY04717.1 MFS general substrate transporter [Basidiobolus meristosporus CBS 931.73]